MNGRVTNTPGEIYVRASPCVCKHCLDENWGECEVGGWVLSRMKTKGMRNPNAKHILQQLHEENLALPEEEYEMLSIQDQKVKAGELMYLIEWKGYEKMSWVRADVLNAPEILEDWEIQCLHKQEDSLINKQ